MPSVAFVRRFYRDATVLKPGMVFHLPIAFCLAGKGCVGFSETVAVTGDGCEVLTRGERGIVVS